MAQTKREKAIKAAIVPGKAYALPGTTAALMAFSRLFCAI